jgi:hypothetical protein
MPVCFCAYFMKIVDHQSRYSYTQNRQKVDYMVDHQSN